MVVAVEVVPVVALTVVSAVVVAVQMVLVIIVPAVICSVAGMTAVCVVIASTISRFDHEILCSNCIPTARSETAWHGGIHRRLDLRVGTLSWPPRRGPEGASDSVDWGQNPPVAGGFASEANTFAKRQDDCAV